MIKISKIVIQPDVKKKKILVAMSVMREEVELKSAYRLTSIPKYRSTKGGLHSIALMKSQTTHQIYR